MNEQFRVAQKLGLMFRPETPLPDDIKSWSITQLKAKSPALGVSTTGAKKIQEWPDRLQPDLLTRDNLYSEYKYNRKREEMNLAGYSSEAAKQDNRKKNLLFNTDELKFSHRNIFGEDQVKLRFTSFWANHFTTGNIWDNQNHIGHLIEEAILANLNGNFSQMLYKVTSHPAMLSYLDNCWSCGENSQNAIASRRDGFQAGLNDNLGRELLELHTVSPSAKYTEADIRGAANVLAGWGIWPGRISDENELFSTAQRHQKLLKMGGTNLCLFALNGEFSRSLENKGSKAMIDFVVNQLKSNFGSKFYDKYFVKATATGWNKNPFTLGAYSGAIPGKAGLRPRLKRPVGDRIFFAGEATAGAYGTVHGANRSGMRAATDVFISDALN